MTITADNPAIVGSSVTSAEMVDLAPEIYRQRLVVEGLVDRPIERHEIVAYLSQLSKVLDMITVLEPVTHESDLYGWAGWIHWETSGAHFYAWDRPRLFFSVDMYTCKWFSNEEAVEFTREFFNARQVVSRAF
ncbi:MAG: S-adenosylmethionine decarboxylase [bacterium]|nr:S-adenosylmethionine decarboxylase [bacterium]